MIFFHFKTEFRFLKAGFSLTVSVLIYKIQLPLTHFRFFFYAGKIMSETLILQDQEHQVGMRHGANGCTSNILDILSLSLVR